MSSKCGLVQSHLNSNCMDGLFLVLVWTTNGQLSQGRLNGRRGSKGGHNFVLLNCNLLKILIHNSC